MSNQSHLSEISQQSVLTKIDLVNNYWQKHHPPLTNAFWHHAAYHTGNMEAYAISQNRKYLQYSLDWAEHNQWKGAKSNKKENWKYTYGETDDYVLFGDWQICFQVYADLYNLAPNPVKIDRAREVIEYQMSTSQIDYWWWADGLYMVMPVMTKMYKITNNKDYLDKLHTYYTYAKKLMFDPESKLFYRDAKYIYPKHKTKNGKKDFWARGNGWVFAALAKVLQDLPKDNEYRAEYQDMFVTLGESIVNCQQPEGFWARSMLDLPYASGYETSGTAFFTYGLLWGINNGFFDKEKYMPTVIRSWNYLTNIALQKNGVVGFVQPIGERADQNLNVGAKSTADFAVGAFLLAASEMYKYVSKE
ncbi:MAG: glycoside hydrolase family 88 protein [Dysgonamonadaceae bacterium]